MRRAWGIARADFMERSRRFSFVAMLALALFGAYCFVPNNDLNVIVVDPDVFFQGGHPSWMTIASAWGVTFFLPLLGFFYVSNSLAYDEKTGVRQLAATSLSDGWPYMIGKFVSGALLLSCIVLTVFFGSLVMMGIYFPGQFIPVYSIISPYFIFLSPILFISALAVLFDSTRFLRKSIGSVAYVLVFFFVLFNLTRDVDSGAPIFTKIIDFTGTTILSEYIGREVLMQSGSPISALRVLAGGGKEGFAGTQILVFHGIDWQTSDIIGLLGMVAISLMLVGISVPVYKFAERVKWIPKRQKIKVITEVVPLSTRLCSYVPRKMTVNNNIIRKLLAELKLMLSGLPIIWWLIAIGCILACALLPLQTAQAIMPLVLLWPISVYSSMGCREHLHDTLQLMAILPKGLSRQVLLTWISGVLISISLLSPVILRMVFASEYSGIFVCFSGAVFIPSLALFLGEWTQTRRAFEVIYVALAYLALNEMRPAGYLEVSPALLSTSRASAYLTIGIIMGILSIVKRIGLIGRRN